MEVKIGVADTVRELVLNSTQTPDEVEALVTAAFQDQSGTLSLVDDKGRRYVVAAAKVAYVEIGGADARKVGFAP
ncbi:DUF3107 domain-containing protein [Actinokineospora bangkokensis]|uniref:ATP-binding protein n=1 Tax=Actinokineospora bangkokensis TaxID=1193682 RepID=A0A1Q9LDS3_9PSEU|nr:DUF3107 domain-containing protein [Actinokineospora bangkokensis]OLR90149.1 ATP-binding protein [Actinokineospora bangkokensis]